MAFTLIGCKTKKEILCDAPFVTSGNMKIVNRQCIAVDEYNVLGFLELENTITHQHHFFTMNVVDGNIVLNLDHAQALSIQKSTEAADNTSAAMAMSAIAATRPIGRSR